MKSQFVFLIVAHAIFLSASCFGKTHICEADEYKVYTDYPGANIDSCRASATHLDVFIVPEDSMVVNPSPWYGFRIEPSPDAGPVELNVLLNYPKDIKHRYVPKLSINGVDWTAIDYDQVTILEEGSALFSITIDTESLYISAQENLASDWYHEWFAELQNTWNIEESQVIGYSHEHRPIEVFETNPAANDYLLFLGRAHPPEIPGAIAMRAFVHALGKIKLTECSEHLSTTCGFFARHNLVVLPLLNPDGVIAGHWRHNSGQVDLNRDWGNFSQPETVAVRNFLDQIDEFSSLQVMLDFHSTNRDVLFIQQLDDPIQPENFISDWLDLVKLLAAEHNVGDFPAGFEPAERPLTDNGTSKNYFYRTYGIPAITFEVGDNVDRGTLSQRLSYFSQALVEYFANRWSMLSQERGDPLCRSVYDRVEPCEDFYCFMIEANKASLVSSAQDGIVAQEHVPLFARAILQDSARASLNEGFRTSNYAVLEPRLIEWAGPEISGLHIGRSRQDLHGTVRRMLARQDWLEVSQSVLDVRKALHTVAAEHIETVVPTYTHGVPAEPTTFAHIVLAYDKSFERFVERLQEGYARVNKSPYGVGVGNTSSVRLDRERLANLLGFDDIVQNSYDANFVSSLDYAIEFASILKNTALVVNQFVENIHSQQRNPWPWIWIRPNDIADSKSTSMPQKRNPRDLDRLRTAANDVIAMADRLSLNAHNVDAGMHDYRMASNVSKLSETGTVMLSKFRQLLHQIVIDADLAIHEIDRSFATSAQITETLVARTDLAFRPAFEFTAKLVELGRATGNTISELSDAEIFGLYAEVIGEPLQVELSILRSAMDARAMVFDRVGIGGPQPSETTRMLELQRESAHDARVWLQQTLASINLVDIALQDTTFELCVDN